jgi:hypothetical protein
MKNSWYEISAFGLNKISIFETSHFANTACVTINEWRFFDLHCACVRVRARACV